jgi:hypothetical protein
LLLIPRLEDLNQYFRAWRVMLNICVIYRGWAYLQTPDVYNKDDVWHTKYNQNIMNTALGAETFQTAEVNKVFMAISQFKGFCGFINFPKMPPAIEKVYVELKDYYSLLNLKVGEDNAKASVEAKKQEEKSKRHDSNRVILDAFNNLKKEGKKVKDIANILNIDIARLNLARGLINGSSKKVV